MKIVKIEIGFIGSSPLGLRLLSENSGYKIRSVFCMEQRLTPELTKATFELGYEVKTFKGLSEFRELVSARPAGEKFFIYQLDMLVSGDLTEKYDFFNLHRGSLVTNRGPNPDIWPILFGEDRTSISIHRINDKIDSGILIDEFEVSLTAEDDTRSLRIKLETGLPRLIESLHEYLVGKKPGRPMDSGAYRPWIKEADFTIDLKKDSFEIADRKIRSQRQYNGAILYVGEKKYYVTAVSQSFESTPSDENFLDLDGLAGRLRFTVNPAPRYPPPPIRPPSKRI